MLVEWIAREDAPEVRDARPLRQNLGEDVAKVRRDGEVAVLMEMRGTRILSNPLVSKSP